MKKFLSIILVLLLVMGVFAACGGDDPQNGNSDAGENAEPEQAQDEEPVTVHLGGLKGPTSMGLVKLLDDAESGLTENEYEFTMTAAADELTPALLKGELDIIAVPANLGAILYNNTDGAVQMAAVNTLGVVYIVEKGGESVNSIEDLAGKTIYATGKGTTPEYALTYLLAQHGLDIETDVTVEWKSEPTEIVGLMANDETAVAMMPQPFVTVAGNQLEDLRIALDLTAEWEALDNGGAFITAGFIVRREFAEEHPEQLEKFLEEYAESAQYVNENLSEASQLVEKYDIVKAAIAEKAIPYCNIVCITGEEMKQAAEGYLQVLFDSSDASVGGQLPGDDFYYGA